MSVGLKELLANKAINQWKLFWLITIPISVNMMIAMMAADLSSGEGVSAMIKLSVRSAVPWLYLAFAASSIYALFPGLLSRWLLRNRKIMGLCFAAAMAWQLLFILWMVTVYRDYYVDEVYVLRDAIEGVLGYAFLIAMVLTSFKFGRSKLTSRQWKLLHTWGIYFIWAYAFSVYWYALFYYKEPDWLDYTYYWTGFLACGLRIAAWARKRAQRDDKEVVEPDPQPAFKLVGILVVVIGLIGASSGSVWTGPAHQHLYGYQLTQFMELYMPYWPFIPYLPLFIVAAGAFLIAESRR
jgi:hypothetical protein